MWYSRLILIYTLKWFIWPFSTDWIISKVQVLTFLGSGTRTQFTRSVEGSASITYLRNSLEWAFKQFQLKLDQVHLKGRTLDQHGKCLPIVNLSFLLWFSLASIFGRRGKYQSLPHLWRFPSRSLENRSFWGCRLYCSGRLCGLGSWSGKSFSKIFRWSLPENKDCVSWSIQYCIKAAWLSSPPQSPWFRTTTVLKKARIRRKWNDGTPALSSESFSAPLRRHFRNDFGCWTFGERPWPSLGNSILGFDFFSCLSVHCLHSFLFSHVSHRKFHLDY